MTRRLLAALLALVAGAAGLAVAGSSGHRALAAPAGGAGFVALATPVRLIDTRTASDGPALAPQSTGTLQVAGRAGVPAAATAAVVSVSAVGPTAAGYLSVYPDGTGRPATSTVNFTPGVPAVNSGIHVGLGPTGMLAVFNGSWGFTHVVVDVTGYYLPGGGTGYVALAPARLLDTRPTGTPLLPGAVRLLPVAGHGGVPPDAAAVELTVTSTAQAAPGWLVAWPGGGAQPATSSQNFLGYADTATGVTVGLGGGAVALLSNVATHVVVDVTGYYTAAGGAGFVPLSPVRVLDTRTGAPIGASAGLTVPLAGATAGVPSGAAAVLATLTVVAPPAAGYASVLPAGSAATVSDLNFGPGQVVADGVVSPLASGAVTVFNGSAQPANLLLDVTGYFQ